GLIVSESIKWRSIAVTSSTARLNTASFACEECVVPLNLRTNCSADARISSSVAGGAKFASVLMFLHISAPHRKWGYHNEIEICRFRRGSFDASMRKASRKSVKQNRQ